MRELEKHSVVLEEGEFILTTIKEHGGHEGAGEDHWVVISIRHNGDETLWEVPGYYASHDGAYLEEENAFQVKGVEKMVIVYEAI